MHSRSRKRHPLHLVKSLSATSTRVTASTKTRTSARNSARARNLVAISRGRRALHKSAASGEARTTRRPARHSHSRVRLPNTRSGARNVASAPARRARHRHDGTIHPARFRLRSRHRKDSKPSRRTSRLHKVGPASTASEATTAASATSAHAMRRPRAGITRRATSKLLRPRLHPPSPWCRSPRARNVAIEAARRLNKPSQSQGTRRRRSAALATTAAPIVVPVLIAALAAPRAILRPAMRRHFHLRVQALDDPTAKDHLRRPMGHSPVRDRAAMPAAQARSKTSNVDATSVSRMAASARSSKSPGTEPSCRSEVLQR